VKRIAHGKDNAKAFKVCSIVENQIADGLTATHEDVFHVAPFLDDLHFELGIRPIRTVGQPDQHGQVVLSNPTVDQGARRSDPPASIVCSSG
jgi:hypothetical protein